MAVVLADMLTFHMQEDKTVYRCSCLWNVSVYRCNCWWNVSVFRCNCWWNVNVYRCNCLWNVSVYKCNCWWKVRVYRCNCWWNVNVYSIQLFNGCGCNRLKYLPWGPGNHQRFYCTRPSAECNRTVGHSQYQRANVPVYCTWSH